MSNLSHSKSDDVKAQELSTPATDRFANPGLPEHRERLTDTDPKAKRRASRTVTFLFTLSILGTVGMLVAYFTQPPGESFAQTRQSNLLLGLGLFFALFGIGVAAVHWAKTLMSDVEHTEDRHEQRSSDADREAALTALKAGAEDSGLEGVERRGVLKGAAVGALALFPLTIAVPLVASVGDDWNVSKFRHTVWRRGTRLASDHNGKPIRAADVAFGSAYHVIPYAEDIPEEVRPGSHAWLNEKAKAVVLMVRIDPTLLKEEEDRKTWSYDGIVAYSKICTHVGCPVALYEQQTHHLLCPCHQSTFDMTDGAKVVFGPAKRPLPQLPITVDDEGYLVAQSDFTEPIGPSFWERLK